MDKVLFSFGHGYSARALAARLLPLGWRIYGTTRDAAKAETLRADGVLPLIWDDDDLTPALTEATHLLSSVGPTDDGDPVLARHGDQIARIAPHLAWAGYLSTTGVYGDHHGNWVDETTPLTPSTRRGKLRVSAEADWQAITDLPLHLFRLAGIYGPGRGPFAKVREGTARRIIKPGQVFSRIHVDDIAQVLEASIRAPCPGAAYNLCDDDPAPPEDVIAFAAELLNLPVPDAVAFEDADLSPMARSFYSESKRVSNRRIREGLGIRLIHPDYRSGLRAMIEDEKG
jgi:nucleoside-diphosphate-sugar epimerase